MHEDAILPPSFFLHNTQACGEQPEKAKKIRRKLPDHKNSCVFLKNIFLSRIIFEQKYFQNKYFLAPIFDFILQKKRKSLL